MESVWLGVPRCLQPLRSIGTIPLCSDYYYGCESAVVLTIKRHFQHPVVPSPS
jgi:hypothetical protein